jgi:3-deoxy-7-phosphoheptulonate synthase
MEVTDKHQIEAIADKLDALNNPTGVMLQIGTRNAQNFELLRAVGEQTRFPVLYKRGLHTTVSETLQAIEYILQAGNRRVVICLRGLKSGLASPHRNLVDFAHVPVFRRLTSLPIHNS